jgi:hypothetical protein
VSTTARLLDAAEAAAIWDGLRLFMDPPEWLGAPGDVGRVRAALERQVPDFASGALRLHELQVKRLRLKKGKEGWTGQYEATVEGPGDARRKLLLQARVIPPGFEEPVEADNGVAFGADRWRCYLPELRLELQTQPRDPALPALPLLSDPSQARALLEQGIRACSPAYGDISIRSCAIKHVRYKPGSRATVVYQLEYAPEHAGRGWPPMVVAKTYSGDKGHNAYDSMRALWNSTLARGDVVTIAEPLAYLPELKVLVQGPIYEEQTLEDLLKTALTSGGAEAMQNLHDAMRKTAIGLAALHRSGVAQGEAIRWEDELAEVREVIDRLAVPLPALAGAAAPLLERLEALNAQIAPDPAMPSHRAFRPAQVLIYRGRVGFIDFDGFAQAEPALDLSRFLRKTRALGMDTANLAMDDARRLARLAEVELICEAFLAEYESRVPVSRGRIALWESLDLLTLVLYCWTKIEPERLKANMFLLERHLRASGQVSG